MFKRLFSWLKQRHNERKRRVFDSKKTYILSEMSKAPDEERVAESICLQAGWDTGAINTFLAFTALEDEGLLESTGKGTGPIQVVKGRIQYPMRNNTYKITPKGMEWLKAQQQPQTENIS